MRITSLLRQTLRQPRRGWHDVTTLSRRLPDGAKPTVPASLPLPLRAHLRMLRTRPMLTAAACGAAAAAAGDAIAQTIELALDWEGSTSVTWSSRLIRMGGLAVFGGLVVGCGGEVWFRALSKKFPGDTYESVVRLTLDQLLFGPVVLLLIAGFQPIIEGRGLDSARAHIHMDWLHMLGKLWAFWGVSGIASYLLLPPKHQPAAALGTAVLWCAFVSYRIHTLTPFELGIFDEAVPVAEYLRENQSAVHGESTVDAAASDPASVADMFAGPGFDMLASRMGTRAQNRGHKPSAV